MKRGTLRYGNAKQHITPIAQDIRHGVTDDQFYHVLFYERLAIYEAYAVLWPNCEPLVTFVVAGYAIQGTDVHNCRSKNQHVCTFVIGKILYPIVYSPFSMEKTKEMMIFFRTSVCGTHLPIAWLGNHVYTTVAAMVDNGRRGTFTIGDDQFPVSLFDLPCIVKSHKTYDDNVLIKTANVGQMIMVRKAGDPAPEVEYHHGLTPPMRDARRRRFRREPDLNVVSSLKLRSFFLCGDSKLGVRIKTLVSASVSVFLERLVQSYKESIIKAVHLSGSEAAAEDKVTRRDQS
ncbi:transcription initiation factor TFIID subunit 7 [Tanacetum coccineum]